MSPYRFSAVALFDVLGFKGIETQHDPTVVTTTLKAARQAMAELTNWMNEKDLEHFHLLGDRPTVAKAWFSDTICVIAQLPVPPPQFQIDSTDPKVQARLIEVLVRCVGYLIRDAATNPDLPLVFRGVISVGDLIADSDSIYMGPAIREAAELYEIAEGAFIWLTPAAARLPYQFADWGHDGLVWYDVPTKRGTVRTRVLNPFIDVMADSDEGKKVVSGFERAMRGDRIDIVVKRQNTRRLLQMIVAKDPDLRNSDPDALDGLEVAMAEIEASEAAETSKD